MRKCSHIILACGLGLLSTTANANTIQCGQDYTIKPGDSLSLIAKRAYGQAESFSLIYSANSSVIGTNPGNISVGDRISIPCLDGALVESSANPSAIREKTTEALPAPGYNRPIRVLTATGWAPYMDEDQAQGGLLTEITNLALENATGKPKYQIDFINDDGAHLQPLITDHAYDLSIGWSQPNCDNLAKLEDESKFRCNNLKYSEPLYEEVLGYYSTVSEPTFTDHNALRGKRICRAEAFTLAPLEDVDLVEPIITIVRAPDAGSCIDYILEGKADIALVAIDVADGRISELGAAAKVKLHDALSYVDVLHAVIAKTHPRADEILATLNSGLTSIKDSGLWFQTVRRHMTEFRNKS